MKFLGPAVAVVLSCASCTRHGGLNRSVSYGEPAQVPIQDVPAKGFQIAVFTHGGGHMSGELLALGSGHLFLLEGDETLDVPTWDIEKVILDLYSSHAGWMAVWTLAGTGSTLSHGKFLIVTAPIWLAVGLGTSASSYAASEKTVLPGAVVYLWQFARFPAGLPESWPGVHRPPPLVPDAAGVVPREP